MTMRGGGIPLNWSQFSQHIPASSAAFLSCLQTRSDRLLLLRRRVDAAFSFGVSSSAVIGDENMPKVPPTAALCPSSDVAAQQSVT